MRFLCNKNGNFIFRRNHLHSQCVFASERVRARPNEILFLLITRKGASHVDVFFFLFISSMVLLLFLSLVEYTQLN